MDTACLTSPARLSNREASIEPSAIRGGSETSLPAGQAGKGSCLEMAR